MNKCCSDIIIVHILISLLGCGFQSFFFIWTAFYSNLKFLEIIFAIILFEVTYTFQLAHLFVHYNQNKKNDNSDCPECEKIEYSQLKDF